MTSGRPGARRKRRSSPAAPAPRRTQRASCSRRPRPPDFSNACRGGGRAHRTGNSPHACPKLKTLSELTQALASYQTYNPAAWVAIYRFIPVWAGLLLILAGIALLIFGGGKAFRFVAGPLAALAGFLWVPVLFDHLQLELSPRQLALGGAALFGAAGVAMPLAGAFLALGFPAGLLAGQLAGNADWFLGFVPGFLIVGLVAALLHRYVGAVTASIGGGWVVSIGFLSALHAFRGFVEAAAAQPMGVLLAAGIFAAAGSVYQLAVQVTPEEAERLRRQLRQEEERLAEKKALERRWVHHSDHE